MGFFDDISDDSLAAAVAKRNSPTKREELPVDEFDNYDEEAAGAFSEGGTYDAPDDIFGGDVYLGDEPVDLSEEGYEEIVEDVLSEETPEPEPEPAPAPAPKPVQQKIAPVQPAAPPAGPRAPKPQPVPPSPASGKDTEIGAGVEIGGYVRASGAVRVFGTVSGEVSADSVAVLSSGQVLGGIVAKGQADVQGYTTGGVSAATVRVSSCRVMGPIRGGQVHVLDGGVVIGDVSADELVVSGAIKGLVDVKNRVTLRPTAIVKGDISSGKIVIEDGAAIEGTVTQAYAKVSPSAFFESEGGSAQS